MHIHAHHDVCFHSHAQKVFLLQLLPVHKPKENDVYLHSRAQLPIS